jgi:hypothetical protein
VSEERLNGIKSGYTAKQMAKHPQEREGGDPLRAQWERVGDTVVVLKREHRLGLSEPQRLGLGLLGVASALEHGQDRLESLASAERLLEKARPSEEMSAILAELEGQIVILKELEAQDLAHEVQPSELSDR